MKHIEIFCNLLFKIMQVDVYMKILVREKRVNTVLCDENGVEKWKVSTGTLLMTLNQFFS